MAFLYVPNGVNMHEWRPKGEGADFELSPTLEPLENVKATCSCSPASSMRRRSPNGDGPGDHARAMATFLTGCQASKTSGADIKVGVSVDQVAAQQIGKATKFAVAGNRLRRRQERRQLRLRLQLCLLATICPGAANRRRCYKEVNPRLVFDRLFGTAGKIDAEPGPGATSTRRASSTSSPRTPPPCSASSAPPTSASSTNTLTGVREIEERMAKAATGRSKAANVEHDTAPHGRSA